MIFPNHLTSIMPMARAPSRRRLFFASAACILLATGFACRPARPSLRRNQWIAMGTVAAIQGRDPIAVAQAQETAQAVFDDVERLFSVWSETSALAAVNRQAGGAEPVPVTPAFDDLLAQALLFAESSRGAFNPLVAPLMRVWGFHRASATPSHPDPRDVRAATLLADWRAVERHTLPLGPAVRLALPGMALDFGGIAKGYAVDRVWERLAEANHNHLLIDLGGNLRALGEAAEGRGGWRTGVRNPFRENEIFATFLLRPGEAVATSGHYERFVEIGGQRHAHILDARTGWPVAGMAGATVIAPNALTADALSTAMFVLGPEEGARLLRQYPGCEALWIPDTPEQLAVHATPGFAERLAPLPGRGPAPPYTLSIVAP